MSSYKRRYEVHELEGTVKHTVYNIDKEKGGFVKTVVEEPAGWMVYFPNGSSIRVRTEQDLKLLGFHRNPELVDMETGDIVPEELAPVSLKENSERKTSRGRQRTPGLAASSA